MKRADPMSLKFERWTAAQQRAWKAAFIKGDVFEPGGRALHWRPNTVHSVKDSYGHWLGWLKETGGLKEGARAAEGVTPENVARYIDDLRERASDWTVTSRVSQLHMAVKVMAPETDWLWLCDLWKRLDRRAKPLHDKNARLADPADLLACGIGAMEEAGNGRKGRLCERATRYRDGLMVALLAARPFRLANLTQMELGRHLVRAGEGYVLKFATEETKNRHPIEAPFPDNLVPYLETYLATYRPLLYRCPNRDPKHAQRLWLSIWGRGLCGNMVYRRIVALTEEKLGRAINPHAFRHAAATSIAFADPEHVRIIMPILGHGSLATSDEYYNLAQAVEASRRYYEHLQSLRE